MSPRWRAWRLTARGAAYLRAKALEGETPEDRRRLRRIRADDAALKRKSTAIRKLLLGKERSRDCWCHHAVRHSQECRRAQTALAAVRTCDGGLLALIQQAEAHQPGVNQQATKDEPKWWQSRRRRNRRRH